MYNSDKEKISEEETFEEMYSIKKEETAKQSLMNKLVRSIPPKRHEQFIKEADEYIKRVYYNEYNHGKTKSARIQKRNVFSTDKNEM